MKKLLSLFAGLLLVALFFTACEKEEPVLADEAAPEIEIIDIVADDIEVGEVVVTGATGRGGIPPILLGPDLVVASFSSNLINNGNCAVPIGAQPLPNATCNGAIGGSNNFTLLIRVSNIGNMAVAPGSFKVSWALTGFPLQGISIVNHPGIPAGGSIGVTRNWSLPCPTSGPPFGLISRNFTATVDVGNVVNETNENNNVSRPYTICDDI